MKNASLAILFIGDTHGIVLFCSTYCKLSLLISCKNKNFKIMRAINLKDLLFYTAKSQLPLYQIDILKCL